MALSWAEIKEEFDLFGQDLRWLQTHDSGLNYRGALLVGCGCEMLAAIAGNKQRRGETVLAQLVLPGDWRLLAKRLYTALRDGLVVEDQAGIVAGSLPARS
jgi:hypothetical protein